MLKSELANLFGKPMDRKSFLQHVGAGLVAVIGITTIVKTLNGFSSSGSKVNDPSATSYGSSIYGGRTVQPDKIQG